MTDIPLFKLLFEASPTEGIIALENGLKRSNPRAWAAWQTLQHQQIRAAIEDQVAHGSDPKLGTVLAAVWSDVANVRAAINPALTPAGVSRTVTLVKHEFEWANKPVLTINVDGVSAVRVEFELAMSLGIEAATLTIRDARIHRIEMGRFRIEAKLLCDGKALWSRPLKEGRLPGAIESDAGIPLRHTRYDETSFGNQRRGPTTGHI
ncbi:hypothetical protein LMG24238_00868 [Paraburkholderia sediminicola]|uniref:Uncharacterized protein n=1 Tax=Paraburkholderia sediminicola TaxID=458836 RepID=A0A6J4ZZB5_9BURK|nr:hypothetical protein [Paraburkholderia sediminicola]CAB3647436.1 hypothetical protein LMG24238_00868 [Paraburkholderia sediminicola]